MPFRYEHQIRQRLADMVDGIIEVHGAPAGTRPEQLRQPAPCLYVMFVRADPVDDSHPTKSLIQVVWQVLVHVQNLEAASDGMGARAEAQAIGQKVFKALHGWAPGDHRRTFKFAGASARLFESGRHLAALDFSITYVIGD